MQGSKAIARSRSAILLLLATLTSGCVSYTHESPDGSITKVVRLGLQSEIEVSENIIPHMGINQTEIGVRGGLPPEAYMEVINEIQSTLNKSGWGRSKIGKPGDSPP